MDADLAARAEAIAHLTRIRIMGLLAKHPDGLPAGGIAQRLDVTATTLSSHLATLSRNGLVDVRRAGTSLVYSTNRDAVEALLSDVRSALLPT